MDCEGPGEVRAFAAFHMTVIFWGMDRGKLCKWIEGLPYSEVITCNTTKNNEITAAIAKLKAEQWSEDQIANLLLSQTKKEQLKLFADDADKTPVHGGAFDVPAIMADGGKNY